MTNFCKHFYVEGRVQGVWFRAETKKQADLLQLTGWVCNLDDGRVELVACGSEQQLQRLEEWLHHGPALAEVTKVIAEPIGINQYDEFTVRR